MVHSPRESPSSSLSVANTAGYHTPVLLLPLEHLSGQCPVPAPQPCPAPLCLHLITEATTRPTSVPQRPHAHTRECVQVETRKEHNKTVPEDVGTTTMLWKEEETLSHKAARFLRIRNKFSAYNTRTAGKLSQTYAMTRLYFRSQSK